MANNPNNDATIQYAIRIHIDYAGMGDKHPRLIINARSKEDAIDKADWAVKRMFASGDLQGAGLRGVEYEPEEQMGQHWEKIIRDVKQFVS
jgi:hypothetical protein